MGSFYESKFMKMLQRFGQKVAGNKACSAISGGMMASLAIILAGAVFQILAVIPTIFHLYTTESTIYQTLMIPYNMTMGLISVPISFGIAYYYAKALKMKAFVNGLNSLMLFLLVAAPVQKVTLADQTSTFTGLATTSLGSVGIFTAIIIAIFSVRIAHFFEKHNITIKMPEAVPQFLQDSFNALIPLVVNLIFWQLLNMAFQEVLTVNIPMGINSLLSLPLKALTSVPGMIVISIIACLLWSFGIHGTMVVSIAVLPAIMQYVSTNATLVAEGKAPLFAPIALFSVMSYCGGTGNTLPLVIMGLRSKSKQIKGVSKAALVPALFNINEPVTFGYPIMYNPILAIPFIFNSVFTILIIWLGYMINFFQPSYVMISAQLPIGFGPVLGSLAWQNAFMPVVAFVVGFVCYYPFYKAYEKQLVDQELSQESVQQVAVSK